jgi:hypothetical protein
MVIFKLYRSGSAIENGDAPGAEAFELAAVAELVFAFADALALLFDSGAVVQPNAASANTPVANAAKILRVL